MRSSPRLFVMLAVVLAVGASLAPSSAQAASPGPEVPPGMFGLGGWAWPNRQEVQALSRRGLRSWRVTLSWADVERGRGHYAWSGYDRLVRRLTSRGIGVMFTLAACPRWACGRNGPPRTAAAKAAWHDFVGAAVRRYAGRGVRNWQVMNEVNGRDQWPRPSARGYAALLRSTAATIRAADPRSKVVLAGLGEKMTIWLRSYLPALYRQPGFARSIDVVAVEGYAPRPRNIARILRTTRRIMRRFGDQAKPVWITEMSWATGGRRHAFVTTPRQQARKLRRAYDMLLACRSRWNLERVYWFPHRDRRTPPGEPDYWGNHNGLITVDGHWKPAMRTFLHYVRDRLPSGHGAASRCRVRR